MPFKKGNKVGKQFTSDIQPESNGRKPGTKNRSTIARKWLEVETEWTNPLTGITELLSLEDQITLAQIKEARDGERKGQPYKNIMDSRHGAPKQEIEHSGEIEMGFDISNLSDEDMMTMLQIAAKAKKAKNG